MAHAALQQQPPSKGHDRHPTNEKQTTAQEATVLKETNGDSHQTSGGCPGTNQSKFDCESISAIAATRQADAAEYFNSVVFVEIGVGMATAAFAWLAARWAKKAAVAATKSANAFVAAEDAHLDVQFIDGGVTEYFHDGVKTGEKYALDIRITNIGRSSANLHWYALAGTEQTYPVKQILKRDQEFIAPMGIDLNALGKFNLRVGYSSPIRQQATLVVEAVAVKLMMPNARTRGQVTKTTILGDIK